MMELSRLLNEEVKMSSLELNDLLNVFRKEEGKEPQGHFTLLRTIDKEIRELENVGISTSYNFVLSSYFKEGRNYRMYELNKAGIMQILNKESSLVRYKTQLYIQGLEEQNKMLIERYISNAPISLHEVSMLGNMIRLQEDRQGMKKGQLKKIVIKKFVDRGTLADITAQQYEEVCRFISSYTYLDIQIGFNLKGVK